MSKIKTALLMFIITSILMISSISTASACIGSNDPEHPTNCGPSVIVTDDEDEERIPNASVDCDYAATEGILPGGCVVDNPVDKCGDGTKCKPAYSVEDGYKKAVIVGTTCVIVGITGVIAFIALKRKK